MLWFDDVSYLTIDGVTPFGDQRARTSLTVHCGYNAAAPYSDAIDIQGNSDHVVVRNLKAYSDDNRKSFVVALYADDLGAPDSCLVTGVHVSSGYMGLTVGGSQLYRATGHLVSGNHVGSPADSVISRGIQVEYADGTVIDRNHVENIRYGYAAGAGQWNVAVGINGYNCKDLIVRNNLVRNVCATLAMTYVDGILLSGVQAERGRNVWVYNNMVLGVRNINGTDIDLNGIGAWQQDSLRVDYNSVYLAQSGSLSASVGSAALAFYGSTAAATARNNILVNVRQEEANVAAAFWTGTDAGKVSDNNGLYVGSYDSSFATLYGSARYKTVEAAQLAGRELHSVSVMPSFVGPDDLHIAFVISPLSDAAIPIAGIEEDFDGSPRPRPGDVAPDIGADEFDHPTTDVGDRSEGMPLEFVLHQNYPNPFNPSTTIGYGLPGRAHVVLAIYNTLGQPVATLVEGEMEAGYHEVYFNASKLASGVYLYRLTAGDYVQAHKLVLLR